MPRPDDCSLTASQRAKVRSEAERALREAGVLGLLPTPMDHIMAVARVKQAPEDLHEPGLIARFRARAERAGQFIKSALSKVVGLFHAGENLIFIDKTVLAVKRRFVGFHECAHGFLRWQRPMYALVEDCEKSLDGATAALFDREANVFASEVLFQLDTFHEMASAKPFGIFTPVRLAKDFNASIYASIRQYVSKSNRICAVVVMNAPQLMEGCGMRATLRRAIQSETFTNIFGQRQWPEVYSPDDEIGAFIPLNGNRASQPRSLGLRDSNGILHDCVAEAFSSTHQVFVLIHSVKTLTARRIFIPA